MDSNNTKQNESSELKFSEVFFAIIEKIWIVAIAVVLMAAVAFIYCRFFATPMYSSSTSLYVINNADSDNATTSDVTIATTLVKDYEMLVTSNRVLEKVIADLELDMTPGQLRAHVGVANETGTRILDITVVDANKEMAVKVADAIRETVISVLPEIMKVEATTIDVATVPSAPYSPNTFRTVILAAFIGAALSAVAIVIAYIANDKFRSVEDIEKHLGLSVLAVIPKTSSKGIGKYSGKYGYGKYGYGRYGKQSAPKDPNAEA